MTWLTIQTLPSILLALALGLLLGWLIWARRWEPTRTTRRELLGHLVFTHRRELLDRDSQLAILREQLDEERRENADTIGQLRRELAAARPGGAAVAARPLQAAGPLPAEKPVPAADGDDLERIEGIGPKTAAALRAAGVTTYDALAATPGQGLDSAVRAAGLRSSAALATWPAQARLLADGDQAGFEQLRIELLAGRRNG